MTKEAVTEADRETARHAAKETATDADKETAREVDAKGQQRGSTETMNVPIIARLIIKRR